MKSIAYDEPLRAEEQGDIRLTPYNGCGPRFLDTGRFNSIITPHSIGALSSSREGAPFPPVFGRKRLVVQRGYSSPFAFGSLRIASGAWIDTTGGTLAAFLSRVIQLMILVTKMSKRLRNVGEREVQSSGSWIRCPLLEPSSAIWRIEEEISIGCPAARACAGGKMPRLWMG